MRNESIILFREVKMLNATFRANNNIVYSVNVKIVGFIKCRDFWFLFNGGKIITNAELSMTQALILITALPVILSFLAAGI